MQTTRLRVACHLPIGGELRPGGDLVYAHYIAERLLESGRVDLAQGEPNDSILSLDGRFRAGRGQPTVTAVLEAGHLLTRHAYLPQEWMAQSWRVASAARRSTTVLVPSTAMRWALNARLRVPDERIVVVEPLPAARFRRSSRRDLEGLRRERGLPDRYFVYVGSRGRRKNLPFLARAWAETHPHLDGSVGLVLAGPERGGIEGPGVVDLGWVEDQDLPALLSGAVAYLNPSLYEGSGIGPMEAMACGAPALVAATGALPRTVDQGGLMLDAHETSQWRDAMIAVANREDVRRELSANALKLMAERRAHPPDLGPLLHALAHR